MCILTSSATATADNFRSSLAEIMHDVGSGDVCPGIDCSVWDERSGAEILIMQNLRHFCGLCGTDKVISNFCQPTLEYLSFILNW